MKYRLVIALVPDEKSAEVKLPEGAHHGHVAINDHSWMPFLRISQAILNEVHHQTWPTKVSIDG
jgi:hypothetical protein